ncbi:nicotinate-nucleotide pyrophosphorylase (carboxylating) [Allocatelliglobosispora scoriae]|uniref:Nicotinate-nucleotide pyrophosphorylase [carboxylating] n=1 Tax=Allocatelliglobosispora scoriae TaxID=643052 RepID=A0A841BNU7_9ACTN|nr:carboxylating nicotinate-nucleotide diphosphorylase [Allocatelliglobosispora scoriae]MBB5870757.1 nicotinate-nucleotide pyrophosphorylase (carboxylating) [Allocatelliglobosispora scoriae]
MREETARALAARGMEPGEVERIIQTALLEDLGAEWTDVTSTATIPADQLGTAEIVARANGVIAGLEVARAVFETVEQLCDEGGGGRTHWEAGVDDGAVVTRDAVLATVTGPTRILLMGERTALNLLSRMSGVATHTAAWARELAGTKATVLDTRKTTPGLRVLEKYAVRAGGGTNKRMGLYDVAMIKDNHKLAAGSITAAFEAVQRTYPNVTIQVEVTTVDEAREAVDAGAGFLLLDNMEPALLREVVEAVGERAELEATGGLTLEVARKVAETGVDYLSVGGLTHSSPIVDIALDLRVDPAGTR